MRDNQQAMAATVQEGTVDCCASVDCKVPNDSCKVNCCVCLGEFHRVPVCKVKLYLLSYLLWMKLDGCANCVALKLVH